MILFTISHSVFGRKFMEILVNSREMALELSYVYIKYIYGKEKQNFRNHIVLQMTIIVGNRGKIEDVRRKFYNTNSEKDGQALDVIHKIIHCSDDSNILPRCVS